MNSFMCYFSFTLFDEIPYVWIEINVSCEKGICSLSTYEDIRAHLAEEDHSVFFGFWNYIPHRIKILT